MALLMLLRGRLQQLHGRLAWQKLEEMKPTPQGSHQQEHLLSGAQRSPSVVHHGAQLLRSKASTYLAVITLLIVLAGIKFLLYFVENRDVVLPELDIHF